jgi:DNA-binding PucR family transcriptional regulator
LRSRRRLRSWSGRLRSWCRGLRSWSRGLRSRRRCLRSWRRRRRRRCSTNIDHQLLTTRAMASKIAKEIVLS